MTTSGVHAGDYRAFMTCEAKDGWLTVAEQELGAWMRHKYRYWDIDLSVDGQHVLDDCGLKGTGKSAVSLDVRRHEGAGGVSLRARLNEVANDGATWLTELLAHDHRGGGDWVWVSVTNDQGQFVSVPRLAKNLMGALPLTDGPMQFVPEPQIHRHQDVEDVVELLRDESRHGLVFVAGTDQVGRSVDGFTRQVRAWTKEAYGLAQVIVLDPLATAEFNRQVGAAHAAKAWSIRTYHPGVLTDDPSDARRHRYLTRATQSGNVPQLLGVIARGQSATRQLPSSVEKIRRAFERLENSALVEALTVERPTQRRPTLPGLESPQGELPLEGIVETRSTIAPPSRPGPPSAPAEANIPLPLDLPSPAEDQAPLPLDTPAPGVEEAPSIADEVSVYLAQIELVKRVLGISSLSESELLRVVEDVTRPAVSPEALAQLKAKLDRQQDLINELRDERSALQEALVDEQFGHLDTQGVLDKARDTEKWLRSRLKDVEDYDAAQSEVPDEWRERQPASFSELVELLEAADDAVVVFTGDADTTIALDVHDPGTACRAAWDAVLVLRDYVRARTDQLFDGSVDQYLKNTPTGYFNCPAGKHAQGETAITMQQWGHERVFPVPAEVDPTGCATMAAHFKLARIARISPRLHYYDDYLNSGRIYIGYIGPHLTNTQS